MTGRERPRWSIEEFVRALRDFDNGRGPVEEWTRLNEISMWRVDELAERGGRRTWSILVAPVEPGQDQNDIQRRLYHALRSAQLGALSLPAFWQLSNGRVSVSRALVVYEIEARRAVRLAHRYGQVAAVHVQRVPFVTDRAM